MSLGVESTILLRYFSWEKLLKIASEALYKIQTEGRNYTIIKIFCTTNFSDYIIDEIYGLSLYFI